MSSTEFAKSKDEELSGGPLTTVEFFLLENILVYCDEEEIEPTSINVAAIYNKILASVDDPNVKLRKMTNQQFHAFLTHHQKNFTKFKTFCDMQLYWNRDKEI